MPSMKAMKAVKADKKAAELLAAALGKLPPAMKTKKAATPATRAPAMKTMKASPLSVFVLSQEPSEALKDFR